MTTQSLDSLKHVVLRKSVRPVETAEPTPAQWRIPRRQRANMTMDPVTQSHYELTFKVAYMEKKGEDFQGFFSTIMEKRYPSDFVRVRPWGRVGDRKNDGYLGSKRMLFQSYAPNEMDAVKCIEKIDEDFTGALPFWQQYFDVWIFVHNSRIGLGPDVTAKLLSLRQAHAPLQVTHWGFEELRREAMALPRSELASLFGPAPSLQGLVGLGMSELVPVLDHISRLSPTAQPDLRPVPADKLQRNMLSSSVEVLLRAGMSRADLVRRFFKLQPMLQDKIAASLRAKYHELRDGGVPPDDVFAGLQRFAGGELVPTPGRQDAVLATLAFFFEECDIFERPEPLPKEEK